MHYTVLYCTVPAYRAKGPHPLLSERVDEVVHCTRVPREPQAEDVARQEAVLRDDHVVAQKRGGRLEEADLPERHENQAAHAKVELQLVAFV